MNYRIFTNDRGKKKGVPMYSALCEVDAESPNAAAMMVNQDFGMRGGFAPIKAILWPPAIPQDEAWLLKHVGAPPRRPPQVG